MSRDILKDRESAFEYEFFHKVDEQLLERLRESLHGDARRKALADVIGIRNEAVLQELDELDIRCDCILALSLFPLVYVAWSDGSVDPRERAAVLQAAKEMGHAHDTVSLDLLEAWLDRRPSDKFFIAWKDYVTALLRIVSPAAAGMVSSTILSRARRVAEAAGGFLGVHRISIDEEAAIAELHKVFSDASHGVPQVEAES